mgnify:CR=1 FL=1
METGNNNSAERVDNSHSVTTDDVFGDYPNTTLFMKNYCFAEWFILFSVVVSFVLVFHYDGL